MMYSRVVTVYGKNQKFISSAWVVDNAIEQYKNEQIKMIRNDYKWNKVIDFIIQTRKDNIVDENGMGEIRAYTLNGFEYIKVK